MARRGVRAAVLVVALAFTAAACAVPAPPAELTGDIAVHDPAFVAGAVGEASFVYSTGDGRIADGNIQVRRSLDGVTWEYAGEVWQVKPDWIADVVPGVDNLWAPELYEHDGTWYLYYSASTFGSNTSVIALATNTTLDPDDPDYAWVDRGPVISSAGTDFNAIDAGIVEDEDGVPWLSFGSFWSGIRLVQLSWPSGLRADDAVPAVIADRQTSTNAIEAPFILRHDGAFYLFVSKDSCCRGVDSTYWITVGRADAVTGPYLDGDGTPMRSDGGTLVLQTDGDRVGPGGQSVSGGLLAFHYYDATHDGAFRLGVLPIRWEEGWPRVDWPDVH